MSTMSGGWFCFFCLGPVWGTILGVLVKDKIPGHSWTAAAPLIGVVAGAVMAIIGIRAMQRKSGLFDVIGGERPAAPRPDPRGHEAYRRDLNLYIRGELTLEQFLDRWSGGTPSLRGTTRSRSRYEQFLDRWSGGTLPPKAKYAEGSEDFRKKIEADLLVGMGAVQGGQRTWPCRVLLGVHENGPCRCPDISEYISGARFKRGQWVRIKPAYRGMGLLAQIIVRSHLEPPGEERYEMMTAQGQMELPADALETPLPRIGEWWEKRDCSTRHPISGSDTYWSHGPVLWQVDGSHDPSVRAAAECGCLSPVNFGKGTPSISNVRFKHGQWVRHSKGGLLGRIMAQYYVEGLVWYDVDTGFKPGLKLADVILEPALPLVGEWWVWSACPKHVESGSFPNKVPPLCDPSRDLERERSAIDCGCLFPHNFGRGNL